jgi:hypothetical protein
MSEADVTAACVPRLDFALSLGNSVSAVGVEKLSRQALFVSYNLQSPLSVYYAVVQLRDA